MKQDVTVSFENAVARELETFFPGGFVPGTVLGAAISGGPDSCALVAALSRLSRRFGFLLEAVTVDHNMRSADVSSADSRFAVSLCTELGVPCTTAVLERGLIERTERDRGKGTEEAARFLRYEIFSTFAKSKNIDVFCLGHNRNDQLETILQHFLQGTSVAGMKQRRGIFFRPLLSISRHDIEEYLDMLGIKARTDSTNADESYLRNRLRRRVIPLLTELCPGWDRAVLRGAGTAVIDGDALDVLVPSSFWTLSADTCFGDIGTFCGCPLAVRLRLLRQALVLLRVHQRIPSNMLLDAARGSPRVSGCGIEISRDDRKILVNYSIGYRKKRGYFGILENPGCSLEFKEAGVKIRVLAEKPAAGRSVGPFSLPLVFRSRIESDEVLTADGGRKSLKKLFSDWKIPTELRDLVPVVERDGVICFVWGSILSAEAEYMDSKPWPDWYIPDLAVSSGRTQVYLVPEIEVLHG